MKTDLEKNIYMYICLTYDGCRKTRGEGSWKGRCGRPNKRSCCPSGAIPYSYRIWLFEIIWSEYGTYPHCVYSFSVSLTARGLSRGSHREDDYDAGSLHLLGSPASVGFAHICGWLDGGDELEDYEGDADYANDRTSSDLELIIIDKDGAKENVDCGKRAELVRIPMLDKACLRTYKLHVR
jgi:hypothetical protein